MKDFWCRLFGHQRGYGYFYSIANCELYRTCPRCGTSGPYDSKMWATPRFSIYKISEWFRSTRQKWQRCPWCGKFNWQKCDCIPF